MPMPPESRDPAPDPVPNATREIVLQAITGPPLIDMTAPIEESLRRREAELAKAQQLTDQARRGTPPESLVRAAEHASQSPTPCEQPRQFDQVRR
jgi:hypothetical protein